MPAHEQAGQAGKSPGTPCPRPPAPCCPQSAPPRCCRPYCRAAGTGSPPAAAERRKNQPRGASRVISVMLVPVFLLSMRTSIRLPVCECLKASRVKAPGPSKIMKAGPPPAHPETAAQPCPSVSSQRTRGHIGQRRAQIFGCVAQGGALGNHKVRVRVAPHADGRERPTPTAALDATARHAERVYADSARPTATAPRPERPARAGRTPCRRADEPAEKPPNADKPTPKPPTATTPTA